MRVKFETHVNRTETNVTRANNRNGYMLYPHLFVNIYFIQSLLCTFYLQKMFTNFEYENLDLYGIDPRLI
jgi:hypothetical protein